MGFTRADVSGLLDRLKEFTADVNIAYDDFLYLALTASGTWQYDDNNQTDYPIIKTNLVSGQQDYSFTTDGSSNLVVAIHKVLILASATSTTYSEIYPVDAQSEYYENLAGEAGTTGTPYRYDKTANGIFLDPTPSYNATNGLKVYISREPSYFTSSDTTKKPGVPGIFHSWFYLHPARAYARRTNNTSLFNRLDVEIKTMEFKIKDFFGFREKDVRKIMSNKRFPFR